MTNELNFKHINISEALQRVTDVEALGADLEKEIDALTDHYETEIIPMFAQNMDDLEARLNLKESDHNNVMEMIEVLEK